MMMMMKVEELENKEGNDVPLTRDLASDCDVTISVTMFYFFYTNDTTKHDLGIDFIIFEA